MKTPETCYPWHAALLLAALLATTWAARPHATLAQEQAAAAYQRAYELVLDEEWSRASTALDDFLRQHARSDWQDDAEFWKCFVQDKQGRADEEAFGCYQDFVENHDDSRYVDDARSYMVQLGQRLARSGKREYMTIIEGMQAEGDEELKLTALDALWQMGDERALDAVLDLYDASASERFRKKIIFALSQFNTPRAAEKLKDVALQDPNPTIRKEAIFWITQRGDTDEVLALLDEIARQETSEEVQEQIVFAYSRLGRAGVPHLIRMARSHPDAEIRKNAIFWLSQTGGPDVLDFFRELLNQTDDEEVQEGLVFAFAHVGDEGRPVLMDLARGHRSPKVRKNAIFWLSQRSDAAVIDFFAELIDSSDDPEVQESLIFAFSQQGRRGVPHLITAARTHRNPEVRKDALFWLSQIGGDAVVSFFAELVDQSDDEEVQKSLVFAFSQMGEVGVPYLIDIAKTHKSPAMRKDAIFWLGQTNDPRARDALLDIVRQD